MKYYWNEGYRGNIWRPFYDDREEPSICMSGIWLTSDLWWYDYYMRLWLGWETCPVFYSLLVYSEKLYSMHYMCMLSYVVTSLWPLHLKSISERKQLFHVEKAERSLEKASQARLICYACLYIDYSEADLIREEKQAREGWLSGGRENIP